LSNFFRQILVLFAPYKTRPAYRESGSPFLGQVPLNKKSLFAPVTKIGCLNFCLKIFMARGFGAVGIQRFKEKICNRDFEKLGPKSKSGRGTYSRSPISSVRRHDLHWRSFRVRRSDKNVF